ncbi:MAG: hypothetical protein WC069_03640 [Candidatus Shapirobacteria bacterium]
MVDKAKLAKYFWDVDVAKIDFENDYLYVINRLLDKGDLDAGNWVLKNYSKKQIIETIKSQHDFSPKSGTFWANYLKIPVSEVACLKPSYRQTRKQLWAF